MKKQKILLAAFSAITIFGGASLLPAQTVKMCPDVPPGCTQVEPCTCRPNPTGGTICSDVIQCG